MMMMMFIHRWAEELDRLTMGWVAKCQQESSHAPSHAPAPPKSRKRIRSKRRGSEVSPPRKRASLTHAQKRASLRVLLDEEEEKTNEMNLRTCESILDTIMSERIISEPFLQITNDYDSYKPMDLTQIKENLRDGVYRNATECATDFRLMITETYKFCERLDKDPLILQAQEMSHKFEFFFAKQIQLTQYDYDIMDPECLRLKEVLAR